MTPAGLPDRRTAGAARLLPWALRGLWVALAAFGAPAINGAVEARSDAVRVVATAGAGIGWLAGVAAMAVPSVLALTATRAIVPLSVAAALASALGGGSGVDVTVLATLAVLCTIAALSADVGRTFVQASAYGDEQRFPLRPPFGYAIATGVSWALWAAAALAGPLLLAARAWAAGIAVSLAAVALTVLAPRRWHLLSRRWLVLVPAGVVVHDPVVLAETLMLPRAEVAGVRLAPATTTAADLTGPATGHALEFTTREPVTALLAPTPATPRGTAIHLTALLVSPSRPGRALVAAAARLPVG